MRWVAGTRIADALRTAERLRSRRMGVCIDYLGEHEHDPKRIVQNLREYLQLIAAIRKRKLDAAISVKLTELGLAVGFREAEKNFILLMLAAHKARVGVWIDMEGSQYTEDTVRLYLLFHQRFPDLAITIQANLRSSYRHLQHLLRHKAKVRLVKGAYKEPRTVAHQTWGEVNRNYMRLLTLLFQKGNEFAIATHDRGMVLAALTLQKKYRKRIEFQVLLGVRESLRRELIEKKAPVRVYVPYGMKWKPYLRRRLRERRRDLFFGKRYP